MAAELEFTYACLPTTQRGRGILIAGDPSSDTIAYANGKSIILRSVSNPKEADVYSEHSYPTTVARFSPNGEWVASGDSTGIVRIWARNDHKLKFEIRALSGSIDDLQWNADGNRIVVCGDGKGTTFARAFMWDSGSNVGEFDGHSKRALSCTFRPTRPFRVITCGEDFKVNYYEGPPFRFKCSRREHGNFVNCVRYAPDGSKFITVGSDKAGFIYHGETGEKLGALQGEGKHTGSIYAASWSTDSKQVLTVSADKTAKIWDVAEDGSGASLNTTFEFSPKPEIEHMQVGGLWLKDDTLVTVSLNGDINLLNPKDSPSAPSAVITGHAKNITALALADVNGTQEIYSSSYDGVMARWQEGVGCLGRLGGKGHGTCIVAVAASEDVLFSIGLDDKLRQTPLPAESFSGEGLALGAQPTSLSAASGLALVGTVNGLLLIRDGSILSSLPAPAGMSVTAVALAPDGTEAAVGYKEGKIHIFTVSGDTLTESATQEHHRGPITVLAYSPDGSLLASGDQNREAAVWDRASREMKVKNMLYHTARISCIGWSPDSSQVATGSLDSSIIVWAIDKPVSSRSTIKGAHQGGVTAVKFRTPGALVSAGDDACLRFWVLPSE